MKASHLRIGNFVNLYGEDCRIQTVGMWVHTDTTVDEAPIESVKPVPLTEEWLIKFGFKVEERKSYSLGHEMGYKVYRFGDLVYNSIQAKWWYIRHVLVKQPEYVHELQNLYFALTGKEL